MKIVVIGGTGLIGTRLVLDLRKQGHEVVPASPSSGVNALTGEGLAEALVGEKVLVDVANSPSWEDTAVMEFFETIRRATSWLRKRPPACNITWHSRSSAPTACWRVVTSARRWRRSI